MKDFGPRYERLCKVCPDIRATRRWKKTVPEESLHYVEGKGWLWTWIDDRGVAHENIVVVWDAVAGATMLMLRWLIAQGEAGELSRISPLPMQFGMISGDAIGASLDHDGVNSCGCGPGIVGAVMDLCEQVVLKRSGS